MNSWNYSELSSNIQIQMNKPSPIPDQVFINFFKIYQETLHNNTYLFMTLAIMIIVVLFKSICQIVEEYIAPAIVYLSDRLKLSEALAGVTLLAFANGAGDVITAIVASDSKEGISYNIGALYGAGLFFMTVVLTLTIKHSPHVIEAPKSMIYRDVGFYIVATLLLPLMALGGKITWIWSNIMLALYGVLVFIVAIQKNNDKHSKSPSVSDDLISDTESLMSIETDSVINRRLSMIRQTLSIADQIKLQLIFQQLYYVVKNRRHTQKNTKVLSESP